MNKKFLINRISFEFYYFKRTCREEKTQKVLGNFGSKECSGHNLEISRMF